MEFSALGGGVSLWSQESHSLRRERFIVFALCCVCVGWVFDSAEVNSVVSKGELDLGEDQSLLCL